MKVRKIRALYLSSKHFWVLQTFERKRWQRLKMMGAKTIYNKMFLKRFMYTVY